MSIEQSRFEDAWRRVRDSARELFKWKPDSDAAFWRVAAGTDVSDLTPREREALSKATAAAKAFEEALYESLVACDSVISIRRVVHVTEEKMKRDGFDLESVIRDELERISLT